MTDRERMRAVLGMKRRRFSESAEEPPFDLNMMEIAFLWDAASEEELAAHYNNLGIENVPVEQVKALEKELRADAAANYTSRPHFSEGLEEAADRLAGLYEKGEDDG